MDSRSDSPTPPASAPDESLPSPSATRRPKGAGFYAAAWTLYAVVRVLAFTYRIRTFHDDGPRLARRHHPKGSYCIALWHEYLFASIIAHRHLPFAPLASLSKDGDLVTFVMDRLGFKTIRGSSSRRGEEARTDMVDITDHGWFTAITVDGPRGPRRRVKGGIVDVARRSGVAIVPLVAAADREWILSRSWDQFKIPKPFARIAVRYGDPIIVSENTQGMAFGEAKKAVRDGLSKAELDARQDLNTWGTHE